MIKQEQAKARPHVLLVDDDATARRSVRRLLELDDVEITEAADGDEALERALEQRDCINVVLLDITMPRRNGLEAFPELALTLPQARIVLMSGYELENVHFALIKAHPSFGGFLTKPYTRGMLREAVR